MIGPSAICIGSKQHSWNRAVYTGRDALARKCLVCGMTGWQWSLEYHDAIHLLRPCTYCEEASLRLRAWNEQAPIRAALREDEREVLSLYGRADTANNRQMFKWQTPQKARETYPTWQTERTERQARARQRALLRQGHRTLTDIRRLLRGAARSQPQASVPARTSRI